MPWCYVAAADAAFYNQLPPGLPGSLELGDESNSSWGDHGRRRVHACVRYSLVATIDVDGMFHRNIQSEQRLLIHANPLSYPQPQYEDTTQKVRFCCCISKGDATLKAWLDKNVYVIGETAQCTAEVDNRSSVEVTKMNIRLERRVELNASHCEHARFGRDSYQNTDVVASSSFQGLVPQTKLAQAMPLLLAQMGRTAALPSTAGQIVKCSYHVIIEMDLPWCPDISVSLPLELLEPDPAAWGSGLQATASLPAFQQVGQLPPEVVQAQQVYTPLAMGSVAPSAPPMGAAVVDEEAPSAPPPRSQKQGMSESLLPQTM